MFLKQLHLATLACMALAFGLPFTEYRQLAEAGAVASANAYDSFVLISIKRQGDEK